MSRAGRRRARAGAPAWALAGAALLLAPALGGLPGGPALSVGLAAQGAGAELALPPPPAARAGLLLRRADGVGRVLMIAAHPDDEDTALLTLLARGSGARAAYLSLTRGEGGQNLVGPELDEALGLLRTGELLAARELDGAEQRFTRAFDFGYSKTAEESFSEWPRDSLLADVVRVVRELRPHVVVSIFWGTPADGHGQHQVAGVLAREAFDAAGDPTRFPDQVAEGLEPWRPLRLYRSTRFSPGDATLALPTGTLDPLLGASAHQVAMAGRSRHRSQDMGRAREPGPRRTTLRLEVDRTDQAAAGAEPPAAAEPSAAAAARDPGLFAGIDTSLVALDPAGLVTDEIEVYRRSLREAEGSLVVGRPAAAADPLIDALATVRGALARLAAEPEGPAPRELVEALGRRERIVSEALHTVAGVRTEVRVAPGLLVPGSEADVRVLLWNGGEGVLEGADPILEAPAGWEARPTGARVVVPGAPPDPVPPWEEEEEDEGAPAAGAPDGAAAAGSAAAAAEGATAESAAAAAAPLRVPAGALAEWRFRLRVPPDAEPSEPYFLRAERANGLYRWPDDPDLRTRPRNPPPVRGGARFRLEELGGGEPDAHDPSASGGGTRSDAPLLEALGPAEHVGVDKASGEYRERLLVVPALSVSAEPSTLAWPLDDSGPREVTVRVRSFASDPVAGSLRLEAPEGWVVEPAEAPFRLDGSGTSVGVAFRVRRAEAAAPGLHTLRGVAAARGRSYDEEVVLVSHPHVERDLMLRSARTRISHFEVAVEEGLVVGYVMGSGDDGPEALRQMGVGVRMLGPDAVRAGDYGGLDAVVLGVRAYETRPDLADANRSLLEYVRGGGTVIVQYNKYEFPRGGFAPYPLDIDRPHDRVTDESAPVRLLDPASPLLSAPNPIGPADFEGWVQERGLYFLGSWDERYTPLLETADPGEEPVRGALVAAPVGRGLYVYTGLALFRQLPEGVPGAYRILANLVSADPDAWRAHHGRPEGTR